MGSLTTVRGLGRISMCTNVPYEIGHLGFGGDSVTPNAAMVYNLRTISFSLIKNESMGMLVLILVTLGWRVYMPRRFYYRPGCLTMVA